MMIIMTDVVVETTAVVVATVTIMSSDGCVVFAKCGKVASERLLFSVGHIVNLVLIINHRFSSFIKIQWNFFILLFIFFELTLCKYFLYKFNNGS